MHILCTSVLLAVCLLSLFATGTEGNRDLLSLSAKTRILQTQISTNRIMRTLMIYLCLTGVHLMGGCLMGVYLMGVYLMGVVS
jgi:serine kinase of HPr protein (carbohydrate metabolism regulator)